MRLQPSFAYKYILVFIISFSFIACSPLPYLTKAVNGTKYNPAELETALLPSKNPITIYIEPIKIEDKLFLERPTVQKKSGLILPLLFIYIARHKVYCEFGNSMSSKPIDLVANDMTKNYFNYFSPLNLSSDTNSNYRLKIVIDSLHASGVYHKKFTAFLGTIAFFSRSDEVEKGKSRCHLSYQLYKKDKLVLTDKITFDYGLIPDWNNSSNNSNISPQNRLKHEFVNSLNYSINFNLQKCLIDVKNKVGNFIYLDQTGN
jgi:hypothetical protein